MILFSAGSTCLSKRWAFLKVVIVFSTTVIAFLFTIKAFCGSCVVFETTRLCVVTFVRLLYFLLISGGPVMPISAPVNVFSGGFWNVVFCIVT